MFKEKRFSRQRFIHKNIFKLISWFRLTFKARVNREIEEAFIKLVVFTIDDKEEIQIAKVIYLQSLCV